MRAGVTYVKQMQLPSMAMQLYSQNLLIVDSVFDSLATQALAAIAFSASNVTFRNCSFTNNVNSAGAGGRQPALARPAPAAAA